MPNYELPPYGFMLYGDIIYAEFGGLILNWKPFKEYMDKFDSYTSEPLLSTDESFDFMNHWKVYAAIALIDTFGRDVAQDIANIIEVCD